MLFAVYFLLMSPLLLAVEKEGCRKEKREHHKCEIQMAPNPDQVGCSASCEMVPVEDCRTVQPEECTTQYETKCQENENRSKRSAAAVGLGGLGVGILPTGTSIIRKKLTTKLQLLGVKKLLYLKKAAILGGLAGLGGFGVYGRKKRSIGALGGLMAIKGISGLGLGKAALAGVGLGGAAIAAGIIKAKSKDEKKEELCFSIPRTVCPYNKVKGKETYSRDNAPCTTTMQTLCGSYGTRRKRSTPPNCVEVPKSQQCEKREPTTVCNKVEKEVCQELPKKCFQEIEVCAPVEEIEEICP